jgi:hypothetical protein
VSNFHRQPLNNFLFGPPDGQGNGPVDVSPHIPAANIFMLPVSRGKKNNYIFIRTLFLSGPYE